MSGSPKGGPPPAAATERRPLWLTLADGAGRLTLGGLFLMAGASKVQDPDGFRDLLVLRSGLPVRWAGPTAAFLPWLELTLGFCLLLGKACREAALVSGLLLALFAAHALWQGGGEDCGCFAFPIRSPRLTTGWWAACRDLFFFLLAIRQVLGRRRKGGSSALPPTFSQTPGEKE